MKTTRSNFSRKAITFGVVIFVCIALVATGFAAWMISSGSTVQEQGNVDVVTVSNADIKINLDNLVGESSLKVDDIVFAPQENDNTGYIMHTATVDNRTENLSFTFSGNVSNGDKVGELTFAVKLPESVINAAGFFKNGENWTYDSERAYITLPSYAVDMDGNPLPTIKKQAGTENTYVIDTENKTAPAKITIGTETTLDSTGITDKGFTYKLNGSTYVFDGEVRFGWGQAFGFGNPGRTLDSRDTTVYSAESYEVTGLTLPEAELLLRLVNFVNAGAVLDSYTFGESSTPLITSGSVKASDIKLSTLGSLSNIAGSTKAEKIDNLNDALEKAEASITVPKYTIVITAQPK